MSQWLQPTRLSGEHVRLEPLTRAHAAGAREAVQEGEIWRHWYTLIPAPDAVEAEIERRLMLQDQGSMLPFAVLTADGRFAGMTTYMNVDTSNRRVEIGSTWYRPSVQRSPLNTEAKWLLLRQAFETLDCIAVEFRTHWFNQQSRRAIERLGAKLDGVLRNHQIASNGSLRDTVVYSIIASEWPAVQAHLQYQLQRAR
jgi:RimJ/RimL family protein N-acetyltransferase